MKQEFPDYSLDMLAHTSSNESPSSPQTFSDRLPPPSIKQEPLDMKDILQEASRRLDVKLDQLDVKGEVRNEADLDRIDPDDDMAGIMMELQKDREKQDTLN